MLTEDLVILALRWFGITCEITVGRRHSNVSNRDNRILNSEFDFEEKKATMGHAKKFLNHEMRVKRIQSMDQSIYHSR